MLSRPIVLSPNELQLFLGDHKEEIAEMALSQPLFAGRPDDLHWATDLVAGYLERSQIGYDEENADCQRYINRAAWDFVLGPIANRTL